MALDRAIRNEGNNGGSVYDDRGILVLLVICQEIREIICGNLLERS